jgi:predicted esterase
MDSDGLIDPLSNLRGAPVFIHTGGKDFYVGAPNQEAVKQILTEFGANIKYVVSENVAHAYPKYIAKYSI